MADPAVVVQGLVNEFGDHRVHDGLDLEVQRGEVVGLLRLSDLFAEISQYVCRTGD